MLLQWTVIKEKKFSVQVYAGQTSIGGKSMYDTPRFFN